MKAISLWQPYATLLAHGFKVYETRSWGTNYRGELAIHAAKRWTRRERMFVNDMVINHPEIADYAVYEWELGCVVATCKLVDIVPTETVCKEISDLVYDLGDYSPNRYAWVLEDIVRITPVSAKGRQGFWEWAA